MGSSVAINLRQRLFHHFNRKDNMEKTISTSSACRPFAADMVTVPFITGDGIGGEITPAMQQVIDKAVAEAYGGKKNIRWMEVQAGQRAYVTLGTYLPEETLKAFADHHVGIKGPLTTPVGGGIRSLNVAMRQGLDLYVCLRPVRYFKGIASPVKHPENVDMVVFRENTEDIYARVERRFEAPRESRLPVCAAPGQQPCHVGSQRQHHEIHRGRIQDVGL